MADILKVGIIGLDTSHAGLFTKDLNDPNYEYYVPGAKVVAAYPGGSPDFELSISRVAGFTEQLSSEFGVLIADSPEEVAAQCDAILILSGDGRVHLDQFRRIAPYSKPVFIDKPLAVNSADATEIFRLASLHHVPLMSSSGARYSEALNQTLDQREISAIIGADTFGPMPIEPTQQGFFWYGIHTIEMLFTIMGSGCSEVSTFTTEQHDVIVGRWQDGRIGVARGNRVGNRTFGAVIHREKGSEFVNVSSHPKPSHAAAARVIVEMFQTGNVKLNPEITLEVIRFIEAANESRKTGRSVAL